MPSANTKSKKGGSDKKGGKSGEVFSPTQGASGTKDPPLQGWKPFSRYPAFGGRGIVHKLPEMDFVRARLFSDPTEDDVVIAATVLKPGPTTKTTTWKLSDEDRQILSALLAQYEELVQKHNGWSLDERTKDWDNSLVCYQAVFCFNAIFRMQGLLSLQADAMKTNSSEPYKLPLKASAFEEPTKEIVQRFGTMPDFMWGWWIDEAPYKGRERGMMQAVETVKSAVRSVYHLRELRDASPTVAALRKSFQGTAVLAVSEFTRKWDKFPITVKKLEELDFFKDVQESKIKAEPEPEPQSEIDELGEGSESSEPAVNPKAHIRMSRSSKGKQKLRLESEEEMAGAVDVVQDSEEDSEEEIYEVLGNKDGDGSEDQDMERDQLQDDNDDDDGDYMDEDDESYQPATSTTKKLGSSKPKRASTSSKTASTVLSQNKDKTPEGKSGMRIRIPSLKKAPAAQPDPKANSEALAKRKPKSGVKGVGKMPVSDESVKQLSAQGRKKTAKPQDTAATNPSGLMGGKGDRGTETSLFIPSDDEDDTVKDVLRTLGGDASQQEKITTVTTFLDIIDTVETKRELEGIKKVLSKALLKDYISKVPSLLNLQNSKLSEAEKLLALV